MLLKQFPKLEIVMGCLVQAGPVAMSLLPKVVELQPNEGEQLNTIEEKPPVRSSLCDFGTVTVTEVWLQVHPP